MLFVMLLIVMFLGKNLLISSHKDAKRKSVIFSDQDLNSLIPNTVAEIDALSKLAKEQALKDLSVLLKIKDDKRNFENTVLFFDKIRDSLMTIYNRIDVLMYVHPESSIISHATQVSTDLLNFFNQEFMSKPVFDVMNEFLKSTKLENSEELYLLNKILEDLRLSGCGLENDQLAKFKDLENQLTIKNNEFMQNIALDDSKLLLTAEELVGTSDIVLAGLPQDKDGFFVVGVDYPVYFEIMKNCSNQLTRERMYNMFTNRAYPKNQAVLSQVVALRQELASMLGFPDYATLDLVTKMAGTPERVLDFLNKINSQLNGAVAQEFEKLTQDLPVGVEVGEDGLLNPWDYDYLCSYYEKKYLNLDENLVAQYFPIETTLTAIFALYEKMLGLRFEIVENAPKLWHQDTMLIKAYDVASNDLCGYIILDLYPRLGKYTHACCGSIVLGVDNQLQKQLPVIFVLANFQKATKNYPSLLKHNEVKTFFHEFGHAMHNLLGRTKYSYFSGTSVLRDFVETPSQMFEEWMFSPEILKSVSRHYVTSKPLPDEIIEKMAFERTYVLSSWVTRQIRLALFSLQCYKSSSSVDFKQLEREIAKEVPLMTRFSEHSHFFASFSHLMGYGASYYGYLWSLVFAKELWVKVEGLGVTSSEAGDLVKAVLSRGGMLHPDELLTNVLGHAPGTTAFERFLNKK